MRPLYLLFGGLLPCFDIISLFNAARPNSDSLLNGVGGAVSVCSGLEDLQVSLYRRRPACG